MADDGRPGLPRPPRRVPPWAADDEPRTTIQAPEPRAAQLQPTQPAPELPPRVRWRFFVPLIVFVLVIGAGAGWLVRAQSLSLDTEKVLDTSGRTVVRVLATTCEGTGDATGVLLGDNLVLTTASAIRRPVSVGVLTSDGRVRSANVLGISTDGIAVLRMIGRLDNPTAVLAPEPPHPQADRAIVGYEPDGDQVIQQAGTARDPKPLREVIGAGSLGAPVFDKDGRLIGLVAGDTVASSKVIQLDQLRPYAAGAAQITPEPTGTCPARGPQTPVVPDLAVANTPLAGEVQDALGDYLYALNRHDFAAMVDTYSQRLAANSTVETAAKQHGTSYAFDSVITEVSQIGDSNDAVNARMTFTVLFSPNNAGAKGQTCNRLDLRYTLVREQEKFRIDQATSLSQNVSCTTD